MIHFVRFVRFSSLRTLSLVAALAACSSPGFGAITYNVFVDTSAINGVVGNLNFQFNPGGGAQSASAMIAGWGAAAGTTFLGAPSLSGDVTGTLPAALTFGNTTGFNDYFHPIQYGSSFQFQLILDGLAITQPNNALAGTTFGIALFDSNVPLNALLTDTPDFIATADINPDGTITITRFNTPGAGPPVTTFSAVPEPSTALLTAAGLLLTGGILRHRVL